MSINLLKTVQSGLGYPELAKIDPNTQEVKNTVALSTENKKSQALITAVLAGIYKLAKSEEGLLEISNTALASDWMNIIFADNKSELLNNIAIYTSMAKESIEPEMNKIAAAAISLIKENTKETSDHISVQHFITSQRNNILPFIPAELHLGDFLNDTTIDDRVNKMQGPISSLMHKIESGFSGNETQETANKKSDY